MSHYDFPRADVKLITDAEATKANMIAGIKGLLAGAKSGDVLVFTNSSHGTYIADTSGDEPSYDEALCPYDVAGEVLKDDELRELFAELTQGVRLTVLSDSCHYGHPRDRQRRPPGPHQNPGRSARPLPQPGVAWWDRAAEPMEGTAEPGEISRVGDAGGLAERVHGQGVFL
jgi:Caspase domain